MNHQTAKYQSYILRLWPNSSQTAWYVSVESIQNGEKIHFSNLETLLVYLLQQTAESLPSHCDPQIGDKDAAAE